MRAQGTFTVTSFEPASIEPAPEPVVTGLPLGIAVIEKAFDGEVKGRSTTVFTAVHDQSAGVGTYVALEAFEGSLNGAAGAFNFTHAATTTGSDRVDEHFAIVPSSGTGGLADIRGTGGLTIDADGTHSIWFEYERG